MKNYPITDPLTLYVGEVWSGTIPLKSESGSITVSAVANYLYADESTSDILATYSSGTVDYDGNVLITPLIGKSGGGTSILPGRYTYFLLVTYNGGLIVALTQEFEFIEQKG